MEELVGMVWGSFDWSKKYPLTSSALQYLEANTIGISFTTKEFEILTRGMITGVIEVCSKLTTESITNLYKYYEKEVSDLVDRMTWGADTMNFYGLSLISPVFLGNVLNIFQIYVPKKKKKKKKKKPPRKSHTTTM
eukprot:TRINITY_DN13966_c0_g1_i3.p1 TRINITY_DN13966_c0_g1~~TRINITY_DN13966_c0_g1_i3.p1  ORF type:complete len:136 (+),score=32.89 TRINITY_DN13966_c0_g1_i3:265-672(+)